MARRFVTANPDMASITNPTGMFADAAMTVGFWFKPTTIPAAGAMLWKLGPAETTRVRGITLGMQGDGTLRFAPSNAEDGSGPTALVAGGDYRVGLSHAGGGPGATHYQITLNGASEIDQNTDAVTEITAADFFRFGDIGNDVNYGWVPINGDLIWGFFLAGVQLTPTQIDNYLHSLNGKDPCALITDFGPAGGITPNALKFLSHNVDTDISGVGNNLTLTGTSVVADFGGVPASCVHTDTLTCTAAGLTPDISSSFNVS